MNGFDVSVHTIRRRQGRRKPFEVRWRAAGRSKVKVVHHQIARRQLPGRAGPRRPDGPGLRSADRRADGVEPPRTRDRHLVRGSHRLHHDEVAVPGRPLPRQRGRGARHGHARTDPARWAWPPGPRELRTALYQHAFNLARPADPGSATAQILDWAQQASLPVGCLSEPVVLRAVLEALTYRLDGSRAAANTIIRKRAVLCGALGYAAECGLLPDNPLDNFDWRVPQSSAALDPAVVASPAQVSALLDAVARTRPELTAFFGCLYYAALRPEEAIALRSADCHLPGSGWGELRLASAAPRTAAAWTSSGASHERRGLKHRPDGSIRMVPVPPVLVAMLRSHVNASGTALDGRLFQGTRGGPLSESVYGRPWRAARALALGPELAASGLGRRPYDLRHAALSLWLNAGGGPAQIAARAGNSVAVLLTVYTHCIDGHDDLLNQQIGRVLGSPEGRGPYPSVKKPAVVPTARLGGKTSGCTNRDEHGRRPPCVRGFPARLADGPQITPVTGHQDSPVDNRLASSKPYPAAEPRHPVWPTDLHQRSANRSHRHSKAGVTIR